MKLVLAGFILLVATIAVGVGCGPKETYCYEDKETCAAKAAEVKADAMYMPEADAEQSTGHCFDNAGNDVPCPG